MPAGNAFFRQTGDPVIDAATHGYYWTLDGTRTITWSISNGVAGEFWVDPFAAIAQIDEALDAFEAVANVQFAFTDYYASPFVAALAGSNINISLDGAFNFFSSAATWAIGFFPDGSSFPYSGAPGDVYVNLNSQANFLPSYAPGSQGFFLMLHELGHTIGLKHPHDSGGTGRPTLSEIGLGAFDFDAFTVMSYSDVFDSDLLAYDPVTPMILDVLALQYIYGPNLFTNAGNDSHRLVDNNRYQTIWDAGGSDWVSAARASEGWLIALPDTRLSDLVDTKAGFALQESNRSLTSPDTLYWLAGDIENAEGSRFADRIFGDASANVLKGLGGRDLIEGGAGRDRILGGGGADTLSGQAGADILRGGGGGDRLKGGGGGDRLIGNAGDDRLVGGGARDNLQGGAGDDTLNGGAGRDTLAGGPGDDLMVGGGGPDRFVFRASDCDATIRGFSHGADRIVVRQADRIGDLDIRRDGDDVTIAFGAVRIIVENDRPGAFDADDFLF